MSLIRSGVGFEGSRSISWDFNEPMVVSMETFAMSRPWPTSTAGERIRSDSVRPDCAMLSRRSGTRDAQMDIKDGRRDSTDEHVGLRLDCLM
jgi:hypothetical protein